jgi:hypothetical protein
MRRNARFAAMAVTALLFGLTGWYFAGVRPASDPSRAPDVVAQHDGQVHGSEPTLQSSAAENQRDGSTVLQTDVDEPPVRSLARDVDRDAPQNQEGAPAQDAWSASMQNSIWQALQKLQQDGRVLLAVDVVQCNRPTCQIHFTPSEPTDKLDASWNAFTVELIRAVGMEETGEPIIKQMSMGTREVLSGTRTMIVSISTEHSIEP